MEMCRLQGIAMLNKKARERQNEAGAQQRSKCYSKVGLSRPLQPGTSLHRCKIFLLTKNARVSTGVEGKESTTGVPT